MTRIGVVVPAHDEQELLPHCLAALHRAAAPVRAAGVRVDVVVVLDTCIDGSAEQAARAGVATVSVPVRNVGAARAAGFDAVLGHSNEDLWLATTDADSTVPPHWLATQLAAFRAGWDAFVGTVRVVDWGAHPLETRARYLRRYQFCGGHPHAHGANLGLSARSYRRVGGIPALPTGEDVALVAALHVARCAVLRSNRAPVTTSARRHGRAPDGFAGHLRSLTAAPIGTVHPITDALPRHYRSRTYRATCHDRPKDPTVRSTSLGRPAMSQLQPAERLLTPGEVAALFRVDPKTVTRWASAGRIGSIRTPGGHRRFRETEVRTLLASLTTPAPPDRADSPSRPSRSDAERSTAVKSA